MVTVLVRGIPLLALLLTSILPAWAQGPKGVGVVTALTGRADLKRPQAPQARLKLRDNLFVRDVVDTHLESVARILLMGKSSVTVRELSRFEIREEILPDGSQRAVINVASGKLRVMVARRLMKPGDEVRIQTPNAVASVRGSDGVFEVSTLPDGRPLTVITAVSGEFQVTLPTTPPFVARGLEFLDGPARVGGVPRSSPAIAMAQSGADAGSPLQLAQVSFTVSAGNQGQAAGTAGFQTWTVASVPPGQMAGVTAGFNISPSGSGTSTPSNANENTLNTTAEVAINTVAQILAGAAAPTPSPVDTGGAAAGGGGGGTIGGPTYDPCQAGGCQPPPPTPQQEPPPPGEVFVAPPPAGNDANPGTESQPVRTLDRGLEIAAANPGTTSTVNLAPGTYPETLNAISNVIVQGAGTDQTFIIAGSPGVSGDNVVNFTLTGVSVEGTDGDPAALFTGNSNFTLTDNVFLSQGDGVVLCCPTGALGGPIEIIDSRIFGSDTGIRLSGTVNTPVTISGNSIVAQFDDGIRLGSTFQDPITIKHNEIWAGDEGIGFRSGTILQNLLEIKHNEIWAEDEGIRFRSGTFQGAVKIKKNEIWTADEEGIRFSSRGTYQQPVKIKHNEIWSEDEGIRTRRGSSFQAAFQVKHNEIWSEDEGIRLSGTFGGLVTIENNEIWAVYADGVRIDGTFTAPVTIQNNEIWADGDAVNLLSSLPPGSVITNNTVTFTDPPLTFGDVQGDVTVSGKKIQAGWDEAIRFDGTVTGDVTIKENRLRAGDEAIRFDYATIVGDVRIRDNRVWSDSDEGIEFESTTVHGDVRIRDNRIRGGDEGVEFEYTTVYGDVRIRNNRIWAEDDEGIEFEYTTVHGDVRIRDNRIRGGDEGIEFESTTVHGDVRIRDNRIWAEDEGIEFEYTTIHGDLRIRGNRIWADAEGIEVYDTTIHGESTISGNTITSGYDGIALNYSTFQGPVTINENAITSSYGRGISLYSSTFEDAVTINKNTIMSDYEGIRLSYGTFQGPVTINQNRITSTYSKGIALNATFEGSVTINRNVIRSQQEGIHLQGTYEGFVEIHDNDVVHAGGTGIRLNGTFDGTVTISDNRLTAGAAGIGTAGSTFSQQGQPTIINNTVLNHDGVQLAGSATFSGNTVTSETDGVRWAEGSSPTISGNTITAGRHGLVWDAPSPPVITGLRPDDIVVTPPDPNGTWAKSKDAPVISENVVKSALASFPTNPALANVGVFVGANVILRNTTVSGFNVGVLTGGNALLQGNIITGNQIGILIVSCCPDLGGGARGSLGGNIIHNNAITGVKILPNIGTISALGNTWNANVQGTNATGKFSVAQTITGPVNGKNLIVGAGSGIRVGP